MKRIAFIFLIIPSLAYSWAKSVDKDRMNDQKMVQVYQESKNKVFAGKKALLAIVINCNSNKRLLMLSHPWVLEKAPVKVRLDKDEPFSLYATTTGGGRVLQIGDDTSTSADDTPSGTIEKMIKKKSLLIRYGEAGGKTVEAEFNISGLEKQLRSACK